MFVLNLKHLKNVKNTVSYKSKSMLLKMTNFPTITLGFPQMKYCKQYLDFLTLVKVVKTLCSTIVRRRKKMKLEVGNKWSQQCNHLY